jgi:hypothetical protein
MKELPIKRYKPANPLSKENWGTEEEQARAFRLMVRHGLYPMYGSQPHIGLGGGRMEHAYGQTWPEAIFSLCSQLHLTESNHLWEVE